MNGFTHIPGVGIVPSGPRQTTYTSRTIKIEDQEIHVDSIPEALKRRAIESQRFQTHYTERSRTPPIIPDEWTTRFATDLQRRNDAAYRYNSASQRREYDREERRSAVRARVSSRRSDQPVVVRRQSLAREVALRSEELVDVSESGHDGVSQTLTHLTALSDDLMHDTAPEPGAVDVPECTCPTSYQCQHRGHDRLDCRPLVRDMPEFSERRDQAAFDR